MSIESAHEWLEVLFRSQLDTYECRSEILVSLADVLDVDKVIGRSYHVTDE